MNKSWSSSVDLAVEQEMGLPLSHQRARPRARFWSEPLALIQTGLKTQVLLGKWILSALPLSTPLVMTDRTMSYSG